MVVLVIRRRKEDWQQKKERKQRRLQGHGHRRRHPQPGELLSRAQAQVFNVLMSTGTKGHDGHPFRAASGGRWNDDHQATLDPPDCNSAINGRMREKFSVGWYFDSQWSIHPLDVDSICLRSHFMSQVTINFLRNL